MPLVVNKYIFSLVPGRSPLLMRPLVKSVMSMLTSQLTDPQLKANISFVTHISLMLSQVINI